MQSSKDNDGRAQVQLKPNGQEEEEGQQQLGENHLEEFSQRIVQLQQTKGEEQNCGEGNLNKQHEFEESTEETLELPIHQQMKIQLSKETWFDLLAFVPRHQLGEIVPQIGNRQFAAIVQPFLHNYGQITLGNISLYWPGKNDSNNSPRARVWPKYANGNEKQWWTPRQQMILPEVEMPDNVGDFLYIRICYLDTYILDFLRAFHQKFLFRNVNLDLKSTWSTEALDGLLTTLSYVLPLIKESVNSIQICGLHNDLRYLYNANSELVINMLKMAHILCIRIDFYQFGPELVNLLNRWLYTPRDHGKPRVLIFPPDDIAYNNPSKVLHFIENSIKMEFSRAKSPCSFFIRLGVRDAFEWHDICMENGETKEKLVIKKVVSHKVALKSYELEQTMVLISRYPSNSDKIWIEANEREALEWTFKEQNQRIELDNPFQKPM